MASGDWWSLPDYDDIASDEAGSESDSDSDGQPSQESAVRHLVELLIDYKLKGILSAKQLCILAYWCFFAGACGRVQELKKAPGDKNAGNYDRHFDRCLGFRAAAKRYARNTYTWLRCPHLLARADGCVYPTGT